MNLRKLSISSFGKFKDYEISFRDGFNVVFGKNEEGKTTLMDLVRLMFYGAQTKSQKKTENPRKRYELDAAQAGRAVLEFSARGREYRLERVFNASDGTDKLDLRDNVTGERVDLGKQTPGEYFFGLDMQTFLRSVYVSCDGNRIETAASGKAKSDTLTDRLLNLRTTGDEQTSYQGTMDRLRAAEEQLYRKRGAAILPRLRERLDHARHALELAKVSEEEKSRARAHIESERRECGELEARIAELGKADREASERAGRLRESADAWKAAEAARRSAEKTREDAAGELGRIPEPAVSEERYERILALRKKAKEGEELLLRAEAESNRRSNASLNLKRKKTLEEDLAVAGKERDRLRRLLGERTESETRARSERDALRREREDCLKSRASRGAKRDALAKERGRYAEALRQAEARASESSSAERPEKPSSVAALLILAVLAAAGFGGFLITGMTGISYAFLAGGILCALALAVLLIAEQRKGRGSARELAARAALLSQIEDLRTKIGECDHRIGEVDRETGYDEKKASELAARIGRAEEALNQREAESREAQMELIRAEEEERRLENQAHAVRETLASLEEAEPGMAEADLPAMRERARAARADYRSALEGTGSPDFESFVAAFRESEARRAAREALKESMGRHDAELSERAAESEARAREFRELSGVSADSPEKASELVNAILAEAEGLSERRAEAFRRLSELKSSISSEIAAERERYKGQWNVAQWEAEIARLERELAENQAKYEAILLAKKELEEAFQELRTGFGAELNRRTTELFRRIVGEEVEHVRVDSKFGLTVQTAGEGITDGDALSSGTIDQSYFALRLAISEMIQEDNNLPLLLDDPFVFYDDERANRAFDLLSEYSRENKKQILLFTCHEKYVDRAKEKDSADVVRI